MPHANSLREYYSPAIYHLQEQDRDVDSPHLLKMGTMQVCVTFGGERLHLCKWDGKPIYGAHKQSPRLKTLCGKPVYRLYEESLDPPQAVDCQLCVKKVLRAIAKTA